MLLTLVNENKKPGFLSELTASTMLMFEGGKIVCSQELLSTIYKNAGYFFSIALTTHVRKPTAPVPLAIAKVRFSVAHRSC